MIEAVDQLINVKFANFDARYVRILTPAEIRQLRNDPDPAAVAMCRELGFTSEHEKR